MPFFTPFKSAIRHFASELKQRFAGENFAPNPAALPSSLASENLGIRGVWIPSTDCKVLTSQQQIAEAMKFLADTGFNTVFPVVWNRGFTAYPSQIMREQFGAEIDARYQSRDPLAELIVEANRVGLKVIPWFEYGFVSSYNLRSEERFSRNAET